MDGSIAASVSLRMRDQLRGVYQAPVGGADTGLFEELLRMPVTESRRESAADAPSAEEDAYVEAAPKASHKASSEPEGEANDDADSDQEAGDEALLTSIPDTSLVQAVAVPATTVEPPPRQSPPGEEAPAPVANTAEQPQPVASTTASGEQTPAAAAQAAETIVERPAEPVDATGAPEAAAESVETAQVAEAVPEARSVPVVDDTVVDGGEGPAPADASLESGQEQSDETPQPSTEVRRSIKVHSDPQGGSTAGSTEAQANVEPQVQSKPQAQLQTETTDPTQTQSGQLPAEQIADRPAVRADGGERREKWFLKDDDGPRVEDYEASAPNQDRPAPETLASTSNSTEPANTLPGADALTSLDEAAAAGMAQSSANVEATALVSTSAQQNAGNAADAPRSDSRMTSQSGVSQVTGGRSAPAPTTQATGGSLSTSDKGGVAGLSQQERVRLVQRVARSFSRLGPEGGQVTLKLHPPQLGVLNMSVRIEGQTMTARLQTETTGARDAILESLPVLRERLAEQGIEIESFQVEVASERDLTADSRSQSQTHNPSSGNSSGDSQGGPRSVDFRRLSRNNSGLETVTSVAGHDADRTRWPLHAPPGRTLDIRA